MSSDGDAPQNEGGETTERMDRLRALLTKPIKIPESATNDGEDADYTAPVAAAAAPQGASRARAAAVEIPPAVRAAAEALDRLGHEHDDERAEDTQAADGAATQPGRPRSRRTWADAYLALPDKTLTPEEVRTELTAALREQSMELRELLTKQAGAQEKSATELSTHLDDRLDAHTTSIERAASAAREEAAPLQGRIDELSTDTDTLRTDLDAARTAVVAAQAAANSSATAARTAGEAAAAATKKAATATAFAWAGITLALVAAAAAVLL